MWIWRCMMKWSDTYGNSQPLVVLSNLLLDRTGPIGPLCLSFLCRRGGSGLCLLCPLQLIPSLPQPGKLPGWKVHICKPAYSRISSPITNLVSILCILVAILPHTNEEKEKKKERKKKWKKKKKRREVEEFQIEHFLLVDIMAVKGLMKQQFLMLLPSHHNDEKSGCDSSVMATSHCNLWER